MSCSNLNKVYQDQNKTLPNTTTAYRFPKHEPDLTNSFFSKKENLTNFNKRKRNYKKREENKREGSAGGPSGSGRVAIRRLVVGPTGTRLRGRGRSRVPGVVYASKFRDAVKQASQPATLAFFAATSPPSPTHLHPFPPLKSPTSNPIGPNPSPIPPSPLLSSSPPRFLRR